MARQGGRLCHSGPCGQLREVKLVGSYTNVVGLPLQETVGLLADGGYPVYANWGTGKV